MIRRIFNLFAAKYIVRLDDASPYMNIEKWAALESIFDQFSVKPIVAVIPFNQDKSLINNVFSNNFEQILKRWSNKGWKIAMHGCHHDLRASDRNASIIKINDYSEFVGLPIHIQRFKIKTAAQYFRKVGIEVDTFIAPAHGLDKNTLTALKEESDIKIISDGISVWPTALDGFVFVPQQLWRFKRSLFGVRTICYHPEEMTEADIKRLHKDIGLFRNFIVSFQSFEEIANKYESILNLTYKGLWYLKRKISTIIVKVKNK
jgi:predicted deacetylase